MRGPHLTLRLPSGRLMWYPRARVENVTIKYEDEDGNQKTFTGPAVTCRTIDTTHRWVRRGMSGGNLFQNYVQAICRDILMEAVLRCEAAEYPVIGRVHDEVITLVPDNVMYSLKQLNDIMVIRPRWAKDFPITADGYESNRYKK
jgi:DNA polymerase